MTPYTFSRFVYFDTNIINRLAKNRSLWPQLQGFLEKNDLTLGLGTAQIAELADARRLHSSLVALFLNVPTGILKIWDTIIAEEVKAHPQRRTQPLLLYALNAILLEDDGMQKLYAYLSSEGLLEARQDQLLHAQQMSARHAQLKQNFPPSRSGKYVRGQSDEFADIQVMQWLVYDHRDFLEKMQADISQFHPEVFLSIRLYAYVLFYKYYLGKRELRKLSDFGDLGHLFCIPYCELAVMERDLCNILDLLHNKTGQGDDRVFGTRSLSI